jgi:hypothetical protein
MMYFLTIVLDGMPYIKRHLDIFKQLPFKWEWLISEGAALNRFCTSWARPQPARLSRDGTSEYLTTIARNSRQIHLMQRMLWNGKVTMVNAQLNQIILPGVLMQIDADEIWTTAQLKCIHETFAADPQLMGMRFYCRYFVGPDIITLGQDSYGNNPGEWMRAWRTAPGMRFQRHEPPIYNRNQGTIMTREATRELGLVFDHYAYATEAQMAYKEKFYGYHGAVEQWKRLQANQNWPVRLKDFLPWVDANAMATRIPHEQYHA